LLLLLVYCPSSRVGRTASARFDRFAMRFSFNDLVAFFLFPARCGDLDDMGSLLCLGRRGFDGALTTTRSGVWPR
jgi:hypothetical protein